MKLFTLCLLVVSMVACGRPEKPSVQMGGTCKNIEASGLFFKVAGSARLQTCTLREICLATNPTTVQDLQNSIGQDFCRQKNAEVCKPGTCGATSTDVCRPQYASMTSRGITFQNFRSEPDPKVCPAPQEKCSAEVVGTDNGLLACLCACEAP